MNRSSYTPKTNTVGLYDGSAEAQQILRNAQMAVFDQEPTTDGWFAMGALRNAVDYLKGKNRDTDYSFTKSFTENEHTEECELPSPGPAHCDQCAEENNESTPVA
jgi:hypothetical protein